jgi:hypothetical protein
MSKVPVNLLERPSALAIVALHVAAACGGGKPATTPPRSGENVVAAPLPSVAVVSTTSAAPLAAPAAPVSSAAPSTSAPHPSVLTSDAGIIQRLFDDTSRASAVILKPAGAAGGDPLARGLRDFARRAAAGMQPDGPLGTSTLKEKQNVQMDVTLQPGKCYAIVGYSNKVRDLDLYLLLPPGILSGQDTTDDNTPVIGDSRQPMCPVAATPIDYKLGIVADQGAGEVAVQLYSKAH